MIAQIINGKLKKSTADSYSGPFTPGAEVIWLPEKYSSLLDGCMEPEFIYPNDPRLIMPQDELALVNQVNADRLQKVADIQANLPSWAQVETDLDGLANLAEAKVALKKIARVVFWLAKNTSK